MGIVEETMEKESTKKWVISGIQFMTPLKPIYTKKGIKKGHPHHEEEKDEDGEDGEETESCTTPRTPKSKIPVLKCPGAPKKRKAISRSHCNEIKDFFKHPDLESVFLRCVERA